ncbi:MAG: universal stress protein [Treponema sp.]|nr:universal stress protein [Treponema sp.]MBQ4235752.1 universal stress protein [Treponema sp.]MBQ5383489.1 universal stress protein [Treponema sp.]
MIKSLFRKIVVAYNGSKPSLHAVMYGVMMAKIYKCHVKAVYVVDTDSIKRLMLKKFLVNDEGRDFTSELENSAEKDLEYVSKVAKSKGVNLETQVRHGAVWSEVIKAAVEDKADLILLGDSKKTSASVLTHGHLGIQDSEIIGSSTCSVMVVREPNVEQLFKLC